MLQTETKVCTMCGEAKPLEEFHRNPQSADGRHTRCAPCKNGASVGYYQRWTPEQRLAHRRRVLKSRYGVSFDEVQLLYEQQEGCCVICGMFGDRPVGHEKRPRRGGVLVVDHNHETGKVRGLLCSNCNIGLGKFGDSPAQLVQAAHYLFERS